MQYSISNIAWTAEQDQEVYELMSQYGFTGLEVAPERIAKNVFNLSNRELRSFSEKASSKGISIIAMQALHFGYPHLKLFDTKESRKELLEHTKKCIVLANKIGAKALVFGSPKNRRMENLPYDTAEKIAVNFFSELAEYANSLNTVICLEANPSVYGADFITTTKQAVDLSTKINHPGLKINLDIGTITLNGGNYENIISMALPHAGHVHISEPMLNLVSGESNNDHHTTTAAILKRLNYQGWISIEMKSDLKPSNISSVKLALDFVFNLYKNEP